MNNGSNFFSTGRVPSQPAIQVTPLTRARIAFSRATPFQQALLNSMVGDTLEVCNRTFTRHELLSIFNGHQLPRDPEVCKALGLVFLDFSSLEQRIAARGEPVNYLK